MLHTRPVLPATNVALVVNMLIHMYAVYSSVEDDRADVEAPHMNGHASGYSRVDPRIRDADEFELEGLDSDEDSDLTYAHKESRTFAVHS